MSWQIEKARENLRVGTAALRQGEVNAAANRLYYAFYHLAWGALEQAGYRPSQFQAEARDSWRHEVLRGNPRLIARVLEAQLGARGRFEIESLLRTLQMQRIFADDCPMPADPIILGRLLPRLRSLFDGDLP
ncbi:MAG: hypothetical protein JNM84_06405 [Planctomycetes bacterium]|nr:hypothetical protein [Planctomycetota bacterium]